MCKKKSRELARALQVLCFTISCCPFLIVVLDLCQIDTNALFSFRPTVPQYQWTHPSQLNAHPHPLFSSRRMWVREEMKYLFLRSDCGRIPLSPRCAIWAGNAGILYLKGDQEIIWFLCWNSEGLWRRRHHENQLQPLDLVWNVLFIARFVKGGSVSLSLELCH